MIIYIFLSAIALAQEPTQTTQQAQRDIEQMTRALELFYTDCGHYPWHLEYLTSNPGNCGERWGSSPYLKSIPLDPWGRPYEYRTDQRDSFEIRTLGADGWEGGLVEDMDIVAEG